MPYVSKSQHRFMRAAEARDELPKGTASRWAHHTPSIKKLPEHVDDKPNPKVAFHNLLHTPASAQQSLPSSPNPAEHIQAPAPQPLVNTAPALPQPGQPAMPGVPPQPAAPSQAVVPPVMPPNVAKAAAAPPAAPPAQQPPPPPPGAFKPSPILAMAEDPASPNTRRIAEVQGIMVPQVPKPTQPSQIASGQQMASNTAISAGPPLQPAKVAFALDRRVVGGLWRGLVTAPRLVKAAFPRRPMPNQWRPQQPNMGPMMWQNAARQQQMANQMGGNQAMMGFQRQFAGMQAAGQQMGGGSPFMVPGPGMGQQGGFRRPQWRPPEPESQPEPHMVEDPGSPFDRPPAPPPPPAAPAPATATAAQRPQEPTREQIMALHGTLQGHHDAFDEFQQSYLARQMRSPQVQAPEADPNASPVSRLLGGAMRAGAGAINAATPRPVHPAVARMQNESYYRNADPELRQRLEAGATENYRMSPQEMQQDPHFQAMMSGNLGPQERQRAQQMLGTASNYQQQRDWMQQVTQRYGPGAGGTSIYAGRSDYPEPGAAPTPAVASGSAPGGAPAPGGATPPASGAQPAAASSYSQDPAAPATVPVTMQGQSQQPPAPQVVAGQPDPGWGNLGAEVQPNPQVPPVQPQAANQPPVPAAAPADNTTSSPAAAPQAPATAAAPTPQAPEPQAPAAT